MLDCWLTALSLLWGMCIWTFLGSIVTTLLIHLNAASSEYTANITALNQSMAHRKLPQVQGMPPDHISCNMVIWPRPLHPIYKAIQVPVDHSPACRSRSQYEGQRMSGRDATGGLVY